VIRRALYAVPLHDWMVGGTFSPNLLEKKGRFSLSLYDVTDGLAPYAHDFDRFAASSFESVISITPVPVQSKSLAWAAIKIYYGAFFAAHAILRLGGYAVSYIDVEAARRLNDIWKTYGVANGLRIYGGNYEIALDTSIPSLSVKKIDETGGHHALLWKTFQAFLSALQARLEEDKAVTRDAQEFIVVIDSLVAAISRNRSSGLWLTDTRNAINYRQAHGVWFPYTGVGRSTFREVELIISEWMSSLNPELLDNAADDDLIAFFKNCVFVIALCRDFVESLSSSRRYSFVRNGSARLLQLSKAAIA
jgi:hypothetical protein